MSTDLMMTVEKQVVETEIVTGKLKELLLLTPTPKTAGVVALVLGAQDVKGEWRDDVQAKMLRRVDDLNSEDPQQRYAASAIQNMIFSAIVADTPSHRALGVVGKTVKDAAKIILSTELGDVEP